MLDSRLSSLARIAVERESSQKLMEDPAAVIDTSATVAGNKRQLDLLLRFTRLCQTHSMTLTAVLMAYNFAV